MQQQVQSVVVPRPSEMGGLAEKYSKFIDKHFPLSPRRCQKESNCKGEVHAQGEERNLRNVVVIRFRAQMPNLRLTQSRLKYHLKRCSDLVDRI